MSLASLNRFLVNKYLGDSTRNKLARMVDNNKGKPIAKLIKYLQLFMKYDIGLKKI